MGGSGNLWRRSFVVFMALMTLLAIAPAVAAAEPVCIEDGDGSFIKVLCIAAPDEGATLTGLTGVTGTVDPVNAPRTQKVEFYLDGEYLLTDFRSSSNSTAVFDFQLPTYYWVDGAHHLEMLAITRAEPGVPSYVTARVGIDLIFSNNITEVPVNTNSFTPATGLPVGPGETFTLAAVGDGASGEPDAEAVSDLLVAQNPNMFLYLGDIYEKGTRTEFFNWYGEDDRLLGRLRSITNPTVSNHEYQDGEAPGYFDYWDNIPSFYSFDAAGWHFISLNSTNAFRNSQVQLDFLEADLASNNSKCTIAYWADPRFTIGTQGDEDQMDEEWRAVVNAGVDIVLGANDHNYQRWEPLDADGQLDPLGAVNFVVGTGGHGIRPFVVGEGEANPRVARAGDSFDQGGALFLDLNETSADFRFIEANGSVFDSGTIECHDAIPDNDRAALQAISDELTAQLPSLFGTALTQAQEAIAEIAKALAEEIWTADGDLTDNEGKKAFDKMKKAVEKLLEVSNPPAPITEAIDSLVNLSQSMAQVRLDEAIALNGDAGKIAESVEAMNKAAEKLAEGEPHKAIEEYKHAWEKARDAGGYVAIGFRGELNDVTNELAAAASLPGSAGIRAAEAASKLREALLKNPSWTSDGLLTDSDGEYVFARMKKAVEKLREESNPPPVISSSIDNLVELARQNAQLRIDQAIADGGNPDKIAEAVASMNKADEKLAKGEPHKAIDEYKKAWEKAREA